MYEEQKGDKLLSLHAIMLAYIKKKKRSTIKWLELIIEFSGCLAFPVILPTNQLDFYVLEIRNYSSRR